MSKKQALRHTPYTKTIAKTPPPHTRLYLVRHAKPEKSNYQRAADSNMPLSTQGKRNSIFLQKRLIELGVDVIYASDFLRAQQTGEVLANKKKLKMLVDPRLNEIDWQEWKKIRYFNLSEKARRKSLPSFGKQDKQLDRLQSRIRETLDDIVQKNRGKKIAIFTHGNFIRAAVTSVLDADIIGFLSLEIYLASITEIVVDKNNYAKINYINATGHLPQRSNEDLFAIK